MAAGRRPIRIGNASGAIGDGIDQVYRLAKSGNVDAITADYLAEFNIAWRAIDLLTSPDVGYEANFLDQLAWENGDAARLVAEKKIKIVHDGGALNPRGLAIKVDSYFRSLGIENVKVAWVSGDDQTKKFNDGKLGRLKHLDKDTHVESSDGEVLAANAYTGQTGIVHALEAGADIVICGRCCDASPVMGLAYWWHGWNAQEYDKIAGSLMAGHLIECGAYVTGGNFCAAQEIENLHRMGYPIAEIAEDGSCVITKPDGTNGQCTVDTCKAQLLYEIQGTNYLNPDVIANIENATLEEVGRNRIRMTGVRGSAPPATTKLAVCLLAGYQAEINGYCAGLDIDFKFNMMKSQVLASVNLRDFTTFSIEKYGTAPNDPSSQAECTVMIRYFAQSPNKEAIMQFKRALFYNGMQGYCGLHLSMDWRTMEPRPYVKYFPALIPQSEVPLSVQFVGQQNVLDVPARLKSHYATTTPRQPDFDPTKARIEPSETIKRPLGDLVLARSGDKGGNANVGLWVRDQEAYEWLRSYLTRSKIIELLGSDWNEKYTVERCEFTKLNAVHFVIKDILQEGVSSSSVLDGFGKSVGEFIRARVVDLPTRLVKTERNRRIRARSFPNSGGIARL